MFTCFCFTTLSNWLNKNTYKSAHACVHFPLLDLSCMNLFPVLTGLLDCQFPECMIGQSDYFGFGFIILHWKYSITYCLLIINNINYTKFGAKFEKHCFRISRDILYSVFYVFSCKPYDTITNLHNTKMSVSLKWKKDIPKWKTPF